MDNLSYSSHLLTELNELRHFEVVCDVTLIPGEDRQTAGDSYLLAHKAVLAGSSTYFKKLFIGGKG